MSTEPGASTTRAKRRPYRRDQILAAAVELFREKGYHATGIDEIGAAAGITGPAIYRHFGGKDDILESLLLEASSAILEDGRRALAEAASPLDGLTALVELYVAWLLENPALGYVGMYERRNLRDETRRKIDGAERQHVEQWIGAVRAVRPELSIAEGLVAVHAASGLAVAAASSGENVGRSVAKPLITAMMIAAILGLPSQV